MVIRRHLLLLELSMDFFALVRAALRTHYLRYDKRWYLRGCERSATGGTSNFSVAQGFTRYTSKVLREYPLNLHALHQAREHSVSLYHFVRPNLYAYYSIFDLGGTCHTLLPPLAMTADSSSLGWCLDCGENLSSSPVVVKYDRSDGSTGIWAECPACGTIVHPE